MLNNNRNRWWLISFLAVSATSTLLLVILKQLMVLLYFRIKAIWQKEAFVRLPVIKFNPLTTDLISQEPLSASIYCTQQIIHRQHCDDEVLPGFPSYRFKKSCHSSSLNLSLANAVPLHLCFLLPYRWTNQTFATQISDSRVFLIGLALFLVSGGFFSFFCVLKDV